MGGWEARRERGWWLREKTASDTPFFHRNRTRVSDLQAVRFLGEFVWGKFRFLVFLVSHLHG